MSKRVFKVTRPELIDQFVSKYRTADENGMITFSNTEMLMIARATGLKSKKRRHIRKRFRLVVGQALTNFLNSQNKIDNTL
jgi:hypothetical protein